MCATGVVRPTPIGPICVYLVMRGHFPSRDTDSGHIIASAVAKNPMGTQTSWLCVS